MSSAAGSSVKGEAEVAGKESSTSKEGLSMSEEEERLPPDLKEFGSRLFEDMTPDEQLLAAAQRGHGSLVKELLLQGARVSVDENGTTALHQAAQNGFAEVVRIILDHSVDVDLPDSGGYTGLHKAAGKGHLDVLALLINEGCHIDIQDDTYGNTALHEAAWKGFSKSVDLLLKNKSNAFIANRAGCTALHLAAQSGHNQCGRALLYAGCSPDVKNNYGDTPLHTAARYGHAGIARILISARCSVSEQNKNGDTALHIAAAFKRRKIATLLVEGGINPQLTNKQGESATEIARRKEHTSVIEIIHHGHARPTGGVHLNQTSERSKTQSSQQTLSRETTPEISRDNKKKSSGLVSWIKRKFAKEKLEKEGMLKHSGGDGKTFGLDDGNLGLFSQYVKRQGFAYYRDLAGNIRQGPVGYVPNCHCDGTNKPSGLDRTVEGNHAAIYDQMTSTNNALNEKVRELEQHALKKEVKPLTDAEVDIAVQQRILMEKQECLERLRKLNMQEKRIASRHADTGDKQLRDDLQSWLATQISDGRDSDPFSYSIGTKQQRFGDDFDHERIARYEAINSEQFPPPPRLFRSRSDETLTHSEYSFHGRAFKSREAAMEELKTLKHHEEIRERRKLIRAGAKQQSLRTGQGHLPETPHEFKERAGLWVSREHLAEDNAKTDTGCESQDTPKPDVIDGKHNICQKSSHVRSASEVQAQPERVVGRRERSISPKRKVETKAAITPLKSAMRQPRNSSSSANEVNHVYRSNSLPRNSKVDFRNDSTSSAEPKKTVKTVRYDETVKSAEIAQDMPPNLSPAQADETLLPAKREAPIGGHDEKYSENNQLRGPYHGVTQQKVAATDTSHTKDLRDSIVNARKELLARKPEGNRNGETLNRYNVIPTFEKGSRANGYPPGNSRIINPDPRSAYYSQDGLRQNQQTHPDVPFSHYVNGNHNRQLSQANLQNRMNQPYATTSLPRPPRMNGHQPNVPRRAPLPSYEEIQSNRVGKPANPVTAPPSYALNTQPAPLPRYTSSTSHQTTNTNMTRHHVNIPTFQPNETLAKQQKPATVVRRVSQRANAPNPHPTNQWAPRNGIAGPSSAHPPSPNGRYDRSTNSIYSKQHPDSQVEPASDLMSPNNADSCTSSNPDSGYSGNFYDSNPNAGGTLADQTWYQQHLQSTALKMSGKPILRNASHPVLPSQYARNNSQMNGAVGGAKRMVYTNMTSDV